jgi:hypothetical protein
MNSPQVTSLVNCLKLTDVSGTITVPISGSDRMITFNLNQLTGTIALKHSAMKTSDLVNCDRRCRGD